MNPLMIWYLLHLRLGNSDENENEDGEFYVCDYDGIPDLWTVPLGILVGIIICIVAWLFVKYFM